MTVTNASFPAQPTPFLGREKEFTAISQYLQNPACRLLTLTGPGGVGKTRLAMQAGVRLADEFNRGAFFVNLQPVQSTDHLVSTIVDSLNIPFSGQDEPLPQLFNYLRDKEMLLVLDNFETLLTGVDFLPHHVGQIEECLTVQQAFGRGGDVGCQASAQLLVQLDGVALLDQPQRRLRGSDCALVGLTAFQ